MSRMERADLSMTASDNSRDGSRSSSPEPQPPATPSFSEMRRSLSSKSLRDLELRRLPKRVWRKPTEERRLPRDLEQLAIWSARGALRAFISGYGCRAGVNLVLILFRVLRNAKVKSADLQRALAGEDNFRFGGMLGSFVLLWRFTHNALRIWNVGPRGAGKQEYWHAAVAGAVAGLSVFAERPARRITYGQQLFVRGLQGWYNMLHARGLVHVPNGDVLLFGAACGQIMLAWLNRPDSLPGGYRRWITNASRVPPPVLPIDLALMSRKAVPYDEVVRLSNWRRITPANKAYLERWLADSKLSSFINPPHAPCQSVHPWLDSCRAVATERWWDVFRWIVPVYTGLNIIPPLVFRHKLFLKQPMQVLSKAAFGTVRSSAFLATFVVIFQSGICAQRNLYASYGHSMPSWLTRMVLHKYVYWMLGFSTCLSLFVEDKKRRGELALYVLPKGLESIWSIARQRGLAPAVPHGDVLLASGGLAMVMSAYHHDKARLSGLVRALLWQLTGHS